LQISALVVIETSLLFSTTFPLARFGETRDGNHENAWFVKATAKQARFGETGDSNHENAWFVKATAKQIDSTKNY
jgi:hypothetical protein